MVFYSCEVIKTHISHKCLKLLHWRQNTVFWMGGIIPDLNSTENVWSNIKYKLGGNADKKIQSLKSDIMKSDIEDIWLFV